MNEEQETLGERQMRWLMEAAQRRYGLDRINQTILASKIDEMPQTLSNWKRRGIPQDKLLSLSRRLNCTPDFLESGAREPAVTAPGTREPDDEGYSLQVAQRLLSISDDARAVALAWDRLPEELRSYLRGVIDSALAIDQLRGTVIPSQRKQ